MFKTWNEKQLGFGIFALLLLLFGLGTGEKLFFALAGGTSMILVISRWWHWNALKAVDVKIEFVKKRIFPGDSTTIRIEVSNRKSLSVPFMKLFLYTSPVLLINGLKKTELESNRFRYSLMCSLKPRVTQVYEYELTANKRGLYRLDELRIESSDPFGLGKIIRSHIVDAELIVYPTMLAPIPLNTNYQADVGKFTVRRFIFDDPTYNVGARLYMPGDPMKRIDWNVSARTQALHTKQFDYTTEKHIVIVANLHTSELQWMDQSEETKERIISLLATLVKWCSEKGYTYEWMMNIRLPKAGQLLHEKGGTNKKDLMIHLEKLGRLKSYVTVHTETAFAKMRELSPSGNVLMAVTSYRTPKMEVEWQRWQQNGGQVWIINPAKETIEVERYMGSKGKGGRKRVS